MSKTMKALPSGRAIDLAKPSTYEVTVDELDQLLSKLKRFGGFGMSVSQHSVMVADTLYHLTGNPHIAMMGLLHDSAEAYIGDISTPMKAALGVNIEHIESKMHDEIIKQLGVLNQYNLATQPLVKLVDMMALHFEYNDLVATGVYKENDLWSFATNVRIHPAMTRYHEHSFSQAFNYYKDLGEQERHYEEVEYTSLQGKHKCYAERGTHKLGWTNE